MLNDTIAAKAALERARRDLEAQEAQWPRVRWVARALSDALEENHFAERLRIAQEGRGEHH